MVPVGESGTDQRMLIRELTLYKSVILHVQHHSELIFEYTKTFIKTSIKMPKAHSKSTVVDEEDPNGSINPTEGKAHVDLLDKVMTMIGEQVEKNDMADLLEKALHMI